MHDFSWCNEFVLEFVSSEEFLLAYLSGDKDRLYTGMVFAKFPREKNVNSRKTRSLSPPLYLEWNIWNRNEDSAKMALRLRIAALPYVAKCS